jgi:hypothetical protein
MTERLSALGLAKDAYATLWRHRDTLTRLSWPLMIDFAVLAIADELGHRTNDPAQAAGPSFLVLIAAIIGVVLGIPITTSAYRLFLKGPGERLGLRLGPEEGLYFRAALRFIGRMVLFALPMLAVTLLAASVILGGMGVATKLLDLPKWPIAVFIFAVAVIGWLAVSYIAVRYMLVLPAAALGQRMALARSAQLMEGSVGRLWLAYIAVLIPIVALQMIVRGILYGIAAATGMENAEAWIWMISAIISIPIQVYGMFLPIGALAAIYRDVDADKAAVPS